MARQVRSIKGELVDFDLFEVKKQIGEKPISMDVENREKFVYSKRKRGSKRAIGKMLDDQQKNVDNVRNAMDNPPIVKEPSSTEVEKRVSEKPKPTAISKNDKPASKRRIIKKTRGK